MVHVIAWHYDPEHRDAILETHPESPPVTALSSFGGRNDRIEE